jgi:drug/metabolite transporter (DMT)-like permease
MIATMPRLTPQLRGVLWVTLSAACFGSYGIWSRLMTGQLGQFNQAWMRGVLLLAILVPWLWQKKAWLPIQKSDWGWFLVLTLCGGLNQAPYYIAFAHLPLSTATFLFYAALTVAVCLVGVVVYREKFHLTKVLSLALAAAGLGLLFTFSLTLAQWWPAVLAVLAGVMGGTEIALSKSISSKYSAAQIVATDFAMMALENLILAGWAKEALPGWQSFSLPVLVGVLGYAAAMLVAVIAAVKGYQLLEASVGGLVGLSEVVFAALFGWGLFGERLGTAALVGGGLIITAAGFPSLREFMGQPHSRIFGDR